MLGLIWSAMMLISVITGVITGKIDDVGKAVFSGAANSITLCIALAGCICFFSGLMNVAEKSGITKLIATLLSPVIRLIFPRLDISSPAAKAISMNITANMLGLGNAATPFGLKAMQELDKMKNYSSCASDYMITFVVINTASVQIIPTTVALMRQNAGSSAPLIILPCVWIASAFAVILGVAVANIGNMLYKNQSNG